MSVYPSLAMWLLHKSNLKFWFSGGRHESGKETTCMTVIMPLQNSQSQIMAKNPPEKWLTETSSHRSCTEQIMLEESGSRSGVPLK